MPEKSGGSTIKHVFLSHADPDHVKANQVISDAIKRNNAIMHNRLALRHGSTRLQKYLRLLVEFDEHMSRPSPPSWATFMIYCFLGKSDRGAIAGDLEEEFTTTVLPKFGPRRARFWFWTRAISAVAYRNPLCRWLLIGGGMLKIGEWISRKISG
jgi:hypothetical protein